MEKETAKFKGHKDYLEKGFLEELNFKIWVTKGSRFIANRRLLTKSDLSNKALGFLSSYLIIFGLISVYQVSNDTLLSENILAFGSTSLSIMLLLFSQLEAAQDYKTKAKSYHECALELAELYNKLRIFKTLEADVDNATIRTFTVDLSNEYQQVLGKYDNHENIDFDKFKVGNNDYFKLSFLNRADFNWTYYRRTKLLYHTLIGLPPLLTAIVVISRYI